MNSHSLQLACVICLFLTIPSWCQQKAFEINDRLFFPEGITYSSSEQSFFVSSIHHAKIVRLKKGSVTDFISAGQYGFSGGIGLHADDQRGVLWALGTSPNQRKLRSALFKFDLKSGAILATYRPSDTTALLNDLVFTKDGEVYITDTNHHLIYRLPKAGSSLESWVTLAEESYPNGLVTDEKALYVATFKQGLIRIDLASKEIRELTHPGSVATRGLDGLAMAGRTIYGVWNASDKNAENFVARYELSADGYSITEAKVIDKGNPGFYLPTTCVLVKNKLFVIANSHLESMDREGKITAESSLTNPVVLSYTVK